MDPNETLRNIIEAAIEGDADSLREHADNLASWISNGGFAPGPQSAYDEAHYQAIERNITLDTD